VKGKGHSKTTCGQMSTVGGIFSPVSRMYGHWTWFSETYRSY